MLKENRLVSRERMMIRLTVELERRADIRVIMVWLSAAGN